jgi:hypothetical protein
MQRITTKDPRVIQRFNMALKEFEKRHKLAQKIFQLEVTIHYPATIEEQKQAELLFNLRRQEIAFADKQCRRLHTGEIPYSDTFAKLAAAQSFWNYLMDIKRGKRKRQRILEQYKKRAKIDTPLQELKALSMDEIYNRARLAHRQYKEFKQPQPQPEPHGWRN